MNTRRGLVAFAIISAAGACASPGMPPGGPVDTQAPKLLGFVPDSGSVNVKPAEVVFKFNEIVSERPSAGSLVALFLISPRDGAPNVGWHKRNVSVRPRRGWRPNTAYTVTMLPGMSDLRGNASNAGAVMIFSTGPEIPRSRIAGTVFNWVAGTVAPRAFVEARQLTDTTTVYVAFTDSAGTFIFPNLPPGRYSLRGIIDENNNKGLDPREAWDTTTTLADSARVEVLAFARDSVAPRLIEVGIRDTATLELLFEHPIDPNQSLTPASITIKRSDSTDVPVLSVSRGGSRRDTSAVAAGPQPARGIPSTSLLVSLGVPIRQATTLVVRAIGIRSLDGVTGTTQRVATVDPNPPQKTPGGRPPGSPATSPPPPPPPPAASTIR
ncbi:MAG TPA: Ig-like domain-containing protein [Gemmatimonadaceae bacterium]|jgi:hypothetical protein